MVLIELQVDKILQLMRNDDYGWQHGKSDKKGLFFFVIVERQKEVKIIMYTDDSMQCFDHNNAPNSTSLRNTI